MIRVDRIPGQVPESLDKVFSRDDLTEFERAKKHYIDDAKTGSYDFSRYSSADVKRALDRIFHGKCAYCESFYAKTQPVDVEHYRPKGKVDGAPDHRGYWWLAMAWDNLVPSCIDCNRKRGQQSPKPDENGNMVALNARGDFARGKTFMSGKQAAFPLAKDSPRAAWDGTREETDLGLEKRLLLDPTRDDPDTHLVFYVDRSAPEKLVSFVYPKPLTASDARLLPVLGNPTDVELDAGVRAVSAMGAVSIQVYGLNRLSLVQARTKMLRDLEFLLELSISLQSLHADIETRIDGRLARIDAASGQAKAELENDAILDTRISARLTELRDDAVHKIMQMTEPQAQFSALAKAWAAAYLG